MFSFKQIALIATPFVLTGTTYLVFQKLVSLLGPKLGYLGGFLFYWIVWCLLFSWWVLGKEGLGQVFSDLAPRFGRPAWVGVILLAIPLLLGYGYAFPRAIGAASLEILLLSALIAVVNGALEELLWRGAYVTAFEGSWFFGYLYPSIGFAFWHFAPQSIFPNEAPGGNVSLVIAAGAVGLMWGWVAKQSGSIVWTTLSHILFDFSGLGARIYFR